MGDASSNQIEVQFLRAIEAVEREAAAHRSVSFAEFAEAEDGYPEIERMFTDAVQVATKVWGAPTKVAYGRNSSYADLEGIPLALVDSRAVRYAFWSTPSVQSAIAMLSHDADTLRSFELTIHIPTP